MALNNEIEGDGKLLALHIGDVLPEAAAARIEGDATYEYIDGMNTLTLLLDDVSSNEIAAVQDGVLLFCAVQHGPVIFFCYIAGFDANERDTGILGVRIILDGDCPFTVHLVPPEGRLAPPPSNEEAMARLQIVLAERRDRIIKAIRNVLLAGEFTKHLYDMIREQFDTPFNKDEYMKKVDTGHATFPATWSFFASAGIVARINAPGK